MSVGSQKLYIDINTTMPKRYLQLVIICCPFGFFFRATSARQDATGMDITSRCTLGDPNKLPEGVPQPARMPYVSDKHPRQTLEVINLLRKHRELCDVVLVVGAKKIYAHRVILSACSPYFRYQDTKTRSRKLYLRFILLNKHQYFLSEIS